MIEKSVYVFIDASNLWAVQKIQRRFFDFAKLKQYLSDTYSPTKLKIFYYTAYPAEGTRDYDLDQKHKFYTYLNKGLGIEVVKKKLKRIAEHTSEGVTITEKGNMDVEMTIDAVRCMGKYDVAILFSGDSDFLALVNYLKNAGKNVYVYSSKNNVSEELRTGSDGYIDLLDIETDIWDGYLKFRKQK